MRVFTIKASYDKVLSLLENTKKELIPLVSELSKCGLLYECVARADLQSYDENKEISYEDMLKEVIFDAKHDVQDTPFGYFDLSCDIFIKKVNDVIKLFFLCSSNPIVNFISAKMKLIETEDNIDYRLNDSAYKYTIVFFEGTDYDNVKEFNNCEIPSIDIRRENLANIITKRAVFQIAKDSNIETVDERIKFVDEFMKTEKYDNIKETCYTIVKNFLKD